MISVATCMSSPSATSLTFRSHEGIASSLSCRGATLNSHLRCSKGIHQISSVFHFGTDTLYRYIEVRVTGGR